MREIKMLQSGVRLELPHKILSWIQVIYECYRISRIMIAQKEFNTTKSKWLNPEPLLAHLV